MGKLADIAATNAHDAYAYSDRAYTNVIAEENDVEWYLYSGTEQENSRPFCDERKGKYFHFREIEGWASLDWQGKADGTNEQTIFILAGGYRCIDSILPVSIAVVPEDVIQRNIQNGNYNPSEISEVQSEEIKLTAKQQDEFNNFEKDGSLKGEDAKLQEESIKKFITEKSQLVEDYLAKNGNVINTDEARKLFIDLGYNGTNASAVHEASSAVAKEALKKLIAEGTEKRISFYAGGAGSCKTSTIETLIPRLKNTSDAIIDGNLSNYGKALRQFDQYLGLGKEVEVAYVYREPKDAWEAVIKRMLNNKAEMGRAVRVSTFIDNTTGSYNTIAKIIENKELLQNGNFRVHLFDNSLGKGNATRLKLDKFNKIKFEKDLRNQLNEITERYWRQGKLTEEQYRTLLQ